VGGEAQRKRRTYLDVEEVFGENGRTLVNGDTGPIELAPQHLFADGHAQHVTCKLDVRLEVVDVRGTFENLDSRVRAGEKLTCTTARLPQISRTWPLRIWPSPRRTFTISAYLLRVKKCGALLGELDVVEHDKGSLYVEHGAVVDARCNIVVAHGGLYVGD